MASTHTCPICQTEAPDAFCRRCAFTSALASSFAPLPNEENAAENYTKAPAGYELLHELGRGSGAIVWLARESKLDRLVALKLIPAPADRRLVQRLIREGRAIAMLRHPHIVAVHALEATEHASYLAMDFLEGGDLRQLLANRPLPASVSVDLLRKLSDALAHAHAAGVLHRDIKPSNVLLDQSNEPRLADFGLATTTEGGGDLTLPGQVAGTAAYLAPELMAGTEHASPQSDIYGLGAVFYECLTGRPPFVGETSASILAQIPVSDPPAPRLLNPSIPRDLETICLKCLDKIPSRRYVSAVELRADLLRCQNGEPIAARPISRLSKGVRWCRRHPSTAAFAGVTSALLLVLAIGGPLVAVRLAHARAKAANEAAASKAVVNFLQQDLLAQAAPEIQSDREIKLRTVVDRAAAKVDEAFSQQPLVEAQIRETLGSTYNSLGEYQESLKHLQRGLALRVKVLGAEDPSTLRSESKRVGALDHLGRSVEAETLANKIIAIQSRLLGPDHPDTLETKASLANTLNSEGKFKESEALYLAVLEERKRTLGPTDPTTLETSYQLGEVYHARGELASAEALYRPTVAMLERTLGKEHPNTLSAMNYLSHVLLDEGQFAEAEALCKACLDTRERTLGPEHPNTLSSMITLGGIYTREKKLAEADAVLTSMIEKARKSLGRSHPETVVAMVDLARVYDQEGKYDEAVNLGREAIDLGKQALGRDHPNRLIAMGNLSLVFRKQGKLDQAEALQVEALESEKRVLGLSHPATLASMRGLAMLQLQEGKLAEAEAMLRTVLDVYTKSASNDWREYSAMSLLGEVLDAQNRTSEAEPLLLQGYEGLKSRSETIPKETRSVVLRAAQRIEFHYTKCDQPAKAGAWKQALAADRSAFGP